MRTETPPPLNSYLAAKDLLQPSHEACVKCQRLLPDESSRVPHKPTKITLCSTVSTLLDKFVDPCVLAQTAGGCGDPRRVVGHRHVDMEAVRPTDNEWLYGKAYLGQVVARLLREAEQPRRAQQLLVSHSDAKGFFRCSHWGVPSPACTGPRRSTSARKLFRLVQLEQVAERIVQESLVPGAGDERDSVHLDALLLQVADGGIDVVDSDREVVRIGRRGVRLHQVHLLAAGVQPVPWAEIGARQLRHAEHVAIEGETRLRIGDTDGDMVYTGGLHRSILPRTLHSCVPFKTRSTP